MLSRFFAWEAASCHKHRSVESGEICLFDSKRTGGTMKQARFLNVPPTTVDSICSTLYLLEEVAAAWSRLRARFRVTHDHA
jgi:hypothetical protein